MIKILISSAFLVLFMGCRNQQSAGIVDDIPKNNVPTPISVSSQQVQVSIGSGVSRSSEVYAKIKAGSSKKRVKSNDTHVIIMEK